MLNLGCGQYLRNPFFQDFGVKSGGAGCVFLRIILGCIQYCFSMDNNTVFVLITTHAPHWVLFVLFILYELIAFS